MAKAELTVKTDLTPLTSAFLEQDKIINQTQKEVVEFGTEAKAAYIKAWQEANKYNKEIQQGTKELKAFDAAGKSILTGVERLKQLKKEMKDLTGQAIMLKQQGDLVGAEKAIKQVGELKDELNDIQDAIKSVSGNANENLAKGFGKATQIGAQGFEAVLAVQGLVGTENENIQKSLLKLQSVQSLARIAGEFGDIGDRLKEIKLAFTPLTDLYVRGNEALKNFGKTGVGSISNVAGETKTLSTRVSDFAKSGIAGFKSLWATIAANPLGVILVVIGSLITAMVLFKDKIKPLAAMFEFLGDVVNAALTPIKKLAEYFGIIADENERRAEATIKNTEAEIAAITKYYDTEIKLAEASEKNTTQIEYNKEAALRKRIQESIKILEEKQKTEKKLNAEQLKDYKELVSQLNEIDNESRVSLAKRQNDQKKYREDQMKAARDAQIALIKDDQQRDEAALRAKFEEAKDAAYERSQAVYGYGLQAAKAEERDVKTIETQFQADLQKIRDKYNKQRLEKQKALDEKLKALQKDLLDSLLELSKRVDAAEFQNLAGEEKIAKEKEIALKELDLLKQTIIKKGQAEEDFEAKMQHRKAKTYELSAEQISQFSLLEAEIYKRSSNELIALAEERRKALDEINKSIRAQSITNLDQQEQTATSAVNGLQAPKDSSKLEEIQFEEAKQRQILSIQEEYAKKRLDLKQSSLDAQHAAEVKGLNDQLAALGEANDKETQAKKTLLEKQLILTQQQYEGERAVINNEYQKTINDILAKLKELNTKKPFSMAALFGLTDAEFDQMKQALGAFTSELQNTVNAIYDSKNSIVDNEKKKNDELIAEREKNISNLQSELEKAKSLNEEGKANNLDRINAQIAEEEALRQTDLANQRKIKQEKADLAKEQLKLDTLIQASNLAVAVSEVFETYAAVPYVAAGLAAFMVGAFAIQKQAAFKAANDADGYAEGVIGLKGKGTGKSDDIKANLSAGESIITADNTRQHKSLLTAMHENNPMKFRYALIKELEGTGVSLPSPFSFSQKRDALNEKQMEFNMSNDYSELQREMQLNTQATHELIREVRQKNWVDGKGNTIYKKGSHEHIILKNS